MKPLNLNFSALTFLYRIYQLFIAAPIILVDTVVTAIVVVIGCTLGNGHFWGYWPGKIWSRVIVYTLLLPVRVEGREKLSKQQSYVFVANHQGAFDIFLVYGFLGRNFKWMMKHELRSLPLVGLACQSAHHIFVDKRSPSRLRATYEQARKTLRDGMSLVVFPEGSRTMDGRMTAFQRGAFLLADEMQLPVVPLTINGSFNVKQRTKDIYWVFWHPMTLTIHDPIAPTGQGEENVRLTMQCSKNQIESTLCDEYRTNRQ